MKILSHWGKKTNEWDIQEKKKKNPVIRNVPDECKGGKHGEEKYWQSTKAISDVICGDLRGGGGVMFIL